ncbi:hypothetical protein SPBR_00236 [Sporothrix brasiliensis 5110]|uniref:RRM domain-containing protein n=1 Tax=Sporothrix brasiliensis 5110 TaxID=1398154 RepID=A0A0C2EWI4_9PEZI|nr:uncharacterized protein SPBR_00236 [Sporothrix brasiliensis 5110]KIH90944.1 hypothetical protein SPBR_00236 [Sporothrix brasiliensis 5110]
MASSPHAPAEDVWQTKRVLQLETELRLAQDQLRAVSLSNANNVLVLTQIYNIASMPQKSSQALAAIKNLLIQSTKHMMSATAVSPASILPGSGGNTETPPSTGASSQLSPATSSDDFSASDGPGDPKGRPDLLGVTSRKGMKTNNTTEKAGEVKEAATSGKATMPKKQDTATGDRQDKPSTQPLVKQQAKPDIKQHPKQQTKQQAKHLVLTNPQSTKQSSKPGGHFGSSGGDGGDDADDIWQEFSLEEELEGIADAPAMSRAAMRAVLREKEEATRKRMRESADEKRRIAEREGQLLKKTFLRPSVPLAPISELPQTQTQVTPSSRANQGADNKTAHSYLPTSAAGLAAIGQDKSTIDGARKAPGAAPFLPDVATDIDDELDEVNLPPGMISVKHASPKNADRFGIVFNPFKLDAETVAGITGSSQGNDNRRSVLIRNIPHDFSMHKLLAHIHGGVVLMARLVPDIMGPRHGQVAMITFKTAQQAADCMAITPDLLARSEELEGGPLNPGTRMSIKLLPTHTYPSRETIVPADSPNRGLVAVEEKTRCIVVNDFPKQFINDLCTELLLDVRRFPSKMNALEEMWFADDNLHMHFTSVQEAEKAHRIVSIFHFEKYASQVHFVPDPCAAPAGSGSMCGLFDSNGIKLASHGYMGLKSLLESVGLASYSRSHIKPPIAAANRNAAPLAVGKMSFATLLSTARVVAASQNSGTKSHSSRARKQTQSQAETHGQAEVQTNYDNTLIDLCFDTTPDTTSQNSVPASQWDGFSRHSLSAPWTADLMVGLDQM